MAGILGGLIGSYGAAAVTLSFVGSSTVNSSSIPFPSGTAAGDIAILSNNGADSGNNNMDIPNAPSGWTQVHGVADVVGLASSHSYKLLTSADVSAGSVSVSSYPTSNRKLMAVFRPSLAINSGDLSAVSLNAQGTGGIPDNQTIALSSVTSPVIAFVTYYASSAVDPRGSSETMDELATTFSGHWVKYKIYNSNPQNIVISMEDEGTSNNLLSFGLVVA
jgi:hypothetical protein